LTRACGFAIAPRHDSVVGDPTTLNRLYGRAKGKPLRVGQQALVDTLLPASPFPKKAKSPRRRCSARRPLHFEIGFGGGEHMAFRADLLPDHGFIGAEPFLNGVAQALTHIDGDGARIRRYPTCASTTATRLKCCADSRRFALVPLFASSRPLAQGAPCQASHDERRPDRLFAAKLRPGGEFRFGHDHRSTCATP
jgi:tRNA (guanine-N7-)-methyltransferase